MQQRTVPGDKRELEVGGEEVVAGTLQTGLRLEPRGGDATATKKTDVCELERDDDDDNDDEDDEKEMEGAAGEETRTKEEGRGK